MMWKRVLFFSVPILAIAIALIAVSRHQPKRADAPLGRAPGKPMASPDEKQSPEGSGATSTNINFVGSGVATNASFEALLANASNGDAKAQAVLGWHYYNGEGVAEDRIEAGNWWKKAADQGNADAQYGLGCLYDQILGGRPQAFQWFVKAAQQGQPNAQYSVALAYFYGDYGVATDKSETAKWLARAIQPLTVAANQADDVSHQSRVSQRRLGLMYQYGWVVEQDPVKAFQWFLKSAEQGDAPAQQLVSEAYDSGTGVAQDKAEAAKWFSKAFESFTKSAENGDAWAKAALDSMKTSKDVTPINPHDFGFMQLMALTNSDAVNQMTPDEIASAKPELEVLNETTTARLGETPDQVKARYGEPEVPITHDTNDIMSRITGCDLGHYETYHFSFLIYFHDGHAIREQVSRPGMFFRRGPVDTRGFGLEESLDFFRGATGLTNWTFSTNRENFAGTNDLGLEEVWTNGNIKGFREIKRGETTAGSLSVQAPEFDSVEQAAIQRESAREQPEWGTAGKQAARLGETQAQTETHYGTPYNSDAPDQHDHTLIMYKWGSLEVLVDFWHGRDIHETFFGTEEHPDLSDVECLALVRAATSLQNWNLAYSIGSDRIWHSQPPAKYAAQVTRKPGRETSLMIYGPAYIQYQNEIGGPERENQ
jgi:TPR repeat protein